LVASCEDLADLTFRLLVFTCVVLSLSCSSVVLTVAVGIGYGRALFLFLDRLVA
jgi:hypothetical protein